MTLRRGLAIAVIALPVTLFAAARFIKADRFAERIRAGVERTLNRPVQFAGIDYSILNGPGFTITDVVIAEDPAAGLEPFAYVTELTVHPRLLSLLAGKFEISSLRLVEPSLNVSRAADGHWNIQPFLARALTPSSGGGPEIQVRRGRINFKSADLKSVFYFSETDVDISASDDAVFDFKFSGEPSRTDRAAQGFGLLSGRGRWKPGAGKESALELDLKLQKSSIGEILTLLAGNDGGVHGLVIAKAHLEGPLSNVVLKGRFELGDIHRWDLMPAQGEGWPIDFQGKLDVMNQDLEIATKQPMPVVARLHASGFTSTPRWGILGELRNMDAAPLAATARHLGLRIPNGAKLEGKLSGAAGFSPRSGLQGMARLSDAKIKPAATDALEADEVTATVSGDKIQIAPATVRLKSGKEVEIDAAANWRAQTARVRFITKSMDVLESAQIMKVLAAPPVEPFALLSKGVWRGAIHLDLKPNTAPEWGGNAELSAATISMPELASPIEGFAAALQFQGSRASLANASGRSGKIKWTGEFRWDSESEAPVQFRLQIAEADAAAIERELLPVLKREQGFIARTLRSPVTAPEWLDSRSAEGTIEIATLQAADQVFEAVTGRLRWTGVKAALTGVKARWAGASIAAQGAIDLARVLPSYKLNVSVKNWPSKQGTASAGFDIDAAGIGAALLSGLRVKGAVEAEQPGADIRTLAGGFEYAVTRGGGAIKLSEMEVVTAKDTYQAQGAATIDGRLRIELLSGRKTARLTGVLQPLQLEFNEARAAN